MKKKTTKAKRTTTHAKAPALSPHFDMGTATPDKSLALRLVLPVPYKLLGFFALMSGGAGGTVLVAFEPGESGAPLGPMDGTARFATYDVPDPKMGKPLLGHYFREDEFELARLDFLRRTNLDVLNSRRR